MSAAPGLRYWQPSVSVEDLESQIQIGIEDKVKRTQQEYDVKPSLGTISTITLSEWVVPTKLKILESQVEQEVSKLSKTISPSKRDTSDADIEDELIIQIDYDALRQTLAEDHHEQNYGKEQKQSNNIDDIANNSPYGQRTGQEDIADNGEENLGTANALPHLKTVQFDDEVQVFEYLKGYSTGEDSNLRLQFENDDEGSDIIVSPGWKSFKVLDLECMGPVLDLPALSPPPDIDRQQLPSPLDSSDLDTDIATPVFTNDTVPLHLLPPLPSPHLSPIELIAPAKINTSSLPSLTLPSHVDTVQDQIQQQQYDPSPLKRPSLASASPLQLQSLLKYACLTLFASASLISISTLLFGYQHHLHRAFHALNCDFVTDQDYLAVRHRQYLQGCLFEVGMEFDQMCPILQQVKVAMQNSFNSVSESLQDLEQWRTVRDLWMVHEWMKWVWAGYRLGGRTWS
ncbi:hypothetical protein BGZ51_004451 [Haplosporangium sp. Z 767]|nr:hypothetical protein BGZ51_004451 [Haplosporangium sp. Z 767]KAF9195626.1 hypothetical protein BGZ50_004024 [Haplosporangium sp. Z 11]